MAIGLLEDAEDFQLADNVLGYHPLAGQGSVIRFLGAGQRLPLVPFMGCTAVGMQLLQTLIAGVAQQLGFGMELN